MCRDLFSSSVSDERTRQTIREVWDKYQLLLEPHGAVAWRGFQDWLEVERRLQPAESRASLPPEGGVPCAILETANPAKFPEEIERMMGWSPDIPPAMEATNKLPEDFDRMSADYEAFREYLIKRHSAN
jgi:threonine synthase